MRKAVSPLVASVLLIAFTMAIAAVLTAWISSFTTTQKQQTEAFEEKIKCAYANFVADRGYLFYDVDAGLMKVRLKNSGTRDVKFSGYDIWTTDSPTIPFIYAVDPTIAPAVPQSSFIIVTINVTSNLTKIRFTTPCEGLYDVVDQATAFPAGWPTTTITETPLAARKVA